MPCSVCREKGHDKRQCPTKKKEQAEKIKIQRDRLNVALPIILGSPYLAAFVWYELSQSSVQLSKLNYAILAGDAVGLNIPQGATLGALIQKGTGVLDTLEGITKENLAKTVADVTKQREVQESGFNAGAAARRFIEQVKFFFGEEFTGDNPPAEGWSEFVGGSQQN